MNTVPTQPDDDSRARIKAARDAMRAYAGPHLTRDQAAALLEYWSGRAELTLTEALAVLDPYPIAHMTGEHDDTKE